MKIIVLYDSVFGNTKNVAQKIAQQLNCTAKNIKEMKPQDIASYDMLIIGSPTRGFNATPELLIKCKQLNLKGKKVLVFDTRVDITKVNSRILTLLVKFFGYATDKIEKTCKKAGAQIVDSKGFYVEDKDGPLVKTIDDDIKNWLRDNLK